MTCGNHKKHFNPDGVATFICNLRYCYRNADIKFHFTVHTAPLRPLLNGAVRTDDFNLLEWPLYGVLSILILLTVATCPSPLLYPCSSTLCALARDPPATWSYVVRL